MSAKAISGLGEVIDQQLAEILMEELLGSLRAQTGRRPIADRAQRGSDQF